MQVVEGNDTDRWWIATIQTNQMNERMNNEIVKFLNAWFLGISNVHVSKRLIQLNFVRLGELFEEFRLMHLIHTQMDFEYLQKKIRNFEGFSVVNQWISILGDYFVRFFLNFERKEVHGCKVEFLIGWNHSLSTYENFHIYASDLRLWIQAFFVSILLQPRFAKIIFSRFISSRYSYLWLMSLGTTRWQWHLDTFYSYNGFDWKCNRIGKYYLHWAPCRCGAMKFDKRSVGT